MKKDFRRTQCRPKRVRRRMTEGWSIKRPVGESVDFEKGWEERRGRNRKAEGGVDVRKTQRGKEDAAGFLHYFQNQPQI